MNNNQRFDEHIKEQLSDYSPDVHPRIWENIAAQNEKRRPAGFWVKFLNSRNILVTLGLLLTGVSGALFLTRHTNNPAATKKIAPTNNTTTRQNPVSLNDSKSLATTDNTTSLPSTTITTNNITPNTATGSSKIITAVPVSSILVHSPFFESDVQDGPIAFSKKKYNAKDKFTVKSTPGTLAENEENGFNAALTTGWQFIGQA